MNDIMNGTMNNEWYNEIMNRKDKIVYECGNNEWYNEWCNDIMND